MIVAKMTCEQVYPKSSIICKTADDIRNHILHITCIFDDVEFDAFQDGGEVYHVTIEMVEMSEAEVDALPEFNDYFEVD